MTTPVLAALALALALALVVVVLLLVLVFRKPAPPLLPETTASLRAGLDRMGALANSVTQLNSVVTDLRLGLTTVGERLATVERGQTDSSASLTNLLSQARTEVGALQARIESREDLERRTAESVRRLELILAGTQSKGAAGENILERILEALPVEWQVRDFRVGDRQVEFGLKLPNGLVLPIDSKWPATAAVERLAAAGTLEEQQRLKAEIGGLVLTKAREVRKYLDPDLTTAFGVAVVPDAVYDLCGAYHSEAFRINVVVLSYSMVLPYLLMVVHTVSRTRSPLELQRLQRHLTTVGHTLDGLHEELEGRLSRAITMLSNGRDDMRSLVARATASVAAVQGAEENQGLAASAPAPVAAPAPTPPTTRGEP